MRRRVAVLIAVLVGLLAMGASTAYANGGATIAGAPALPFGQNVTGGGFGTTPSTGAVFTSIYQEFWRASLAAGDKVTVAWQVIDAGPQNEAYAAWFNPAVNDFNLELDPVGISDLAPGRGGGSGALVGDRQGAGGRGEFRVTAPAAGAYTLYLYDPCTNCQASMSYALTAYIHHFTRVTVRAPHTVRARRQVKLTGSVFGLSAGTVRLQLSRAARKVVTVRVRVSAAGKFIWKGRLRTPGLYHVSAAFTGDATHQSSAASANIRVTRRA